MAELKCQAAKANNSRQPSNTEEVPRVKAVHVAGHALASCRFGLGFHVAHVRNWRTAWSNPIVSKKGERLSGALGLCETVLGFGYDGIYELGHDGRKGKYWSPFAAVTVSPLEAMACITSTLCGSAAAARFARRSLSKVLQTPAGRHDHDRAQEMASSLASSTEAWLPLREIVWRTAQEFVKAPANWRAILDLAEILKARGSATSLEVPDIINRVVTP